MARRPSGVAATPHTTLVWPSRVAGHWPGPKSHTRTVLSSEPEMARRPFGVTATPHTTPVWPSRVARHWPVSKSHTRTVLSSEPEMARRPFGVTATLCTTPVWPSRVARHWPVSKSHTRTVLSLEPETAHRPSGVIATPNTMFLCPLSTLTLGDRCCRLRADLVSADAGRHAVSNRVYWADVFCRQSMYANCLSVSMISASSSRSRMKRRSALVGSRNRAVWRSSATHSDAKAFCDMTRMSVRDCSSPCSILRGIEVPRLDDPLIEPDAQAVLLEALS